MANETLLVLIHEYYNKCIFWIKDIVNIRWMIGGLLMGFMTLDAWAAFYLNIILCILLYFNWTYLPDKDYHKQLFDLMGGTTIASLILLLL